MVGRHAKRRRPLGKALIGVTAVAMAVVGATILAWHSHLGRTSAAPAPATTDPPATPTTRPTTTTTVPTTITFAAVGDTDLGSTPLLPPSPAAEFAPVRPFLQADVSFANLEGTMTTGTASKCGAHSSACYAFKVPPSYAHLYRAAGFTILNSANNHSYDFGATGVAETSAALKSAALVQAGLPGQIGYVTTHGVKVAFVDVAPYYLTNNLLDVAQFAALMKRAKAHAQIVVVYMHSGAEGASADHVTRQSEFYYGENRGNPYEFAHRAIDLGASLVLGSGPHVWRGMQWYKGHLIVYSMGDFTNYESFSTFGSLALTGVVHVTLSTSGRFIRGDVAATHFTSTGLVVPDASHALWPFVNALSHQDFGTSAAVIGASGAILP